MSEYCERTAVFSTVAQALMRLNADEMTKRGVLGPLATELLNLGWIGDVGGPEMALELFRLDPVIVAVLVELGVPEPEKCDHCGHEHDPLGVCVAVIGVDDDGAGRHSAA